MILTTSKIHLKTRAGLTRIEFLIEQVRNKLDQCLYAIKRIPLNPQRKLLNKKITREVKLLSRLNHENVVR